MMPESRLRLFHLRSLPIVVSAGLALATTCLPTPAHASSSYPPEVQKALDQEFGGSHCVPQCIFCHLTNEGGIGTLNAFGLNLKQYSGLSLGNPSSVVPKFTEYFKLTAASGGVMTDFTNGSTPTPRLFYDADNDGVSDYTELKQGDSPSVKLPNGVDEVCPSDPIMYGCFARVASAPPPADRWGLFSAGLVVLGFAAFRRLKRGRRPS